MKFSAGSYESSDCIITVSKQEELEVIIESIVFEQFGDQIKDVLLSVLKDHNISNLKVECFDKGALDFTIKARLETALKRMGEYHE
jgi:citrate lyase subunit gamma (acyl carrier protein)